MQIDLEELNKMIERASSYDEYVHLVRKYILHGIPFVYEGRENDYFDFRNSIANRWNVPFYDVMIVGSAKLGYSYYKKTVFSLESDIDVAIVNPILFEQYVQDVCELQYRIDKGLETPNGYEKNGYDKFLKYLVKGWMRPDLLPTRLIGAFDKNHWFDYFKSLSYGRSTVGNYKVSCGLFKNYGYMEKYYVESLKSSINNANTI